MTDELKTLKDLNDSCGGTAFGIARAEAIKWIKILGDQGDSETIDKFGLESVGYKDRVEISASNVVDWIRHFFNISEEDLK